MTQPAPVPALPPTKLLRGQRKNATAKTAAQKAAKPKATVPNMAAPAATAPVPPAAKAPAKAAKAAKSTKAQKPTKPAKPAKEPKAAKAPAKQSEPKRPAAAKTGKVKLVRDSFTIPEDEYAALAALKQRALKAAHPVKKSELLRAGIRLLAAQPDAALMTALQAVPVIKQGRPKAGPKKG